MLDKLSISIVSFLIVIFLWPASIVMAESKEKVAKKKANIKVYRIHNLKSGEKLKVMKHPTDHSPVVGKIPSNGRWIVSESRIKRYGPLYWREVSWNEYKGWVKDKYLKYDPLATQAVIADRTCVEKNRGKHCLTS